MKTSRRTLFMGSWLLGLTLNANAVSLAPPVQWQFLNGNYKSQYDTKGIPNNVDDIALKSFSDDFWSRLSSALPEQQDIRQHNPNLITDDAGANLLLREEGEVFLTFLHEGAGHLNSLGYFTFDAENPPKTLEDIQEKIVFPNVSFSNSGGNARGLKSGHTLKIGKFPAGTQIGFILVSNGFDPQQGVTTAANASQIFTTLKALNPEANEALKAHTILLYDQESQHVVLGLEDLLRTSPSCDHDFNDALFTVSSNPPTAINPEALAVLVENPDSDQDGVPDSLDLYPQDSERAFSQRYPEDGSYHTLAFEDNWPAQGDYDMNDLVVQYRYSYITNAQGNIKDLTGFYQVTARGAELHNAFALEIPGTSLKDLARATLSQGAQAQSVLPESGQNHLVFQILDDATRWTPAKGCKFFNTDAACSTDLPNSLKLELTFNTPLGTDTLGFAPYNPFIYRKDQRGLEVHLPNHPPTRKASQDRFGSQDDASSLQTGNTYKTKGNLPWALNIPSTWNHPIEHQPISKSYLRFKNWAESSGSLHPDWFLTDTYAPFIFKGGR